MNVYYFHIRKRIMLLFVAFFSSVSLFAAYQTKNSISQNGTSSQVSNIEIDGALGKLSAILCHPQLQEGETVPLIILMHGFMSNKQDRGMTAIASELQEKRIAYIRFDFNGHGDSESNFQNMTVANEIEDAKKVYEYARSLDFVSDIALLGHSQGGVVASMVAGKLGAENIAVTFLEGLNNK